MRLGSLGRQSVSKFVARKHPEWLVPRRQRPLLAGVALDLKDKDRSRVVLNGHPILIPRIVALPHGVRPPFLGRGHKIFSVGDQNQRGLAEREAGRLDPGVNTKGWRKHIGKIKTATLHPQRRGTGHWREGHPSH